MMLTAFFLLVILSLLALTTLKIYGVVLCFQKKWYVGVAALIVPFFAEIVCVAKLVFKKDLLQ